MPQLPLDKPAGVLVKTTLVDFPGRVAGSFFLKGCNLRCPYCYNTGLVLGNTQSEPLSTINDLFSHLEKRKEVLSGIVISGGEPLINPYTPVIIKKAKELGYKIKLDTNGTLPEELKYFINTPELKPDFIAMDLKTSPDRYGLELCSKTSPLFNNASYFSKLVKQTAQIIAEYPSECREWRTVLVPELVTVNDIKKMAELLPSDASWQFAQFQNSNCLNSSYNNLDPYTDSEITELISFAKNLIPGAMLR